MKGILRAIGYFVLYFALTMIFQIVLSVIFMAVAAAGGLRDEELIIEFANENILGMTLISGILTILALFLIFKLRKKDVKQEWRLNKVKLRDVLAASVTSFSFSFLFSLFTYNSAPMENSIMIQKSAGYYSELFPMLGFILMAVNLLLVAPAAEEIALRGIVYTRVARTTNTIAAIAVSSVLFGFMHFAAGGAVLVIGAMMMAAVFGYIFYKFDSLWICIIAHASANLPDFILYDHPDISDNMLLGLKVFFTCSFAAGIYGIYKMKRRNVIICVIGIAIIVLSGIFFITKPNILASMDHSYPQPETGISNVTFNAAAGDNIKFSFESDIENGELDIILYDSQHNAVYQLDHAASLSIPFTVERTDTYTMAAEYKDFVGNFKLKIRKP